MNKNDATRYVNLIEITGDNPALEVVDVVLEQMMQACSMSGQRFSIITEDDFIVPPDSYDSLSQDTLEEPPEHR